MAPSDPPRGPFGFADPTARFLRITTTEDESGRAEVDGVAAIPGLPVCRVRMRADADPTARGGPGRRALRHYVRAALCEDVADELPWN